MEKIDVLIMSDIHLGSDVSRSKKAADVLKKYKAKKIILLGDIFDDLNFNQLNDDHWYFLSCLREISEADKEVEVIWVEGNHDHLLSKAAKHFLGINVKQEFVWEENNKKYLAVHGHQFDRFLNENIIISWLASFVYLLIQKIDTEQQTFSRFIKRMSKSWLRLSEKVALGAMLYGKLKGVDFVFCGHTHQTLKREKFGIKYYNSGCWTDRPSHFITINRGEIVVNECD